MSKSSKREKVEELLDKTRDAGSRGGLFEAERLGTKAIQMAFQAQAFDLMASLVEQLSAARQQRYRQALDIGTIHYLQETVTEDIEIVPGCWLIEPPFVGADGRRLSVAALQREIPVAVMCREPMTQLRLWPVVAICPGTTVRTKVDPPQDLDEPDLGWFEQAMIELGDWGLQSIDISMPIGRRLEALLTRIDALPLHAGLHEALVDWCGEAQREAAEVA